MNNEIMITSLNDLQELDKFIAKTNAKVDEVKELVVASEQDIKSINADIKDLKGREDTLKSAELKLIHLAGIGRIGEAIANSRDHRRVINRRVEDAKQKIRDDAIKLFVTQAGALVNKSQAHIPFKAQFNLNQTITDAIKGKSKLQGIVEYELNVLQVKLDNNAKETKEKLSVIKQYSKDLVRGLNELLILPVDSLKRELNARQVAKNNEIKQAEAKAKQAEAEAKAEKARAEKLEREAEARALDEAETPPMPEAKPAVVTVKDGRVLRMKDVFENFINDPACNPNKDKVVFGQYHIYLNGEILDATGKKYEHDSILPLKNYIMAIKKNVLTRNKAN